MSHNRWKIVKNDERDEKKLKVLRIKFWDSLKNDNPEQLHNIMKDVSIYLIPSTMYNPCNNKRRKSLLELCINHNIYKRHINRSPKCLEYVLKNYGEYYKNKNNKEWRSIYNKSNRMKRYGGIIILGRDYIIKLYNKILYEYENNNEKDKGVKKNIDILHKFIQ
jgi:hypothetical protein